MIKMNKKEEKNIELKDAGVTSWRNIESPNFIQFEKLGDSIEGMLLDKSTSERYGFGLYTIQTPKDGQKRFHGSKQLDDLMLGVKLQDYIRITYIDNQNLPNGQLKLFDVAVKE